MSKSFSSTTFLVHLLLASTTISSVFAAVTPHRRDPNNDRHSTHCRVKRKGGPDVQVDRPALNTTASTSALPNTATLADAATPSPIPSPTVRQALPPFDYGNRKVRGVNLGGWFMMEPWITPSMFEKTGNDGIVDEFTFGQYQDRAVATAALQAHWSTWYTEQDFADIAAAGLNHVRLPIPFWSVPMDQDTGPYITGAWPYIEAALDWANDHGIYVILDLHGAPGSQNGFDNSGQRTGNPIWAISGQKADYSYIQHTLDVLKTVAQLVGDKVAVIELLNELAGFRGQDWGQAAREFWQAGYDAVRAAAGNDVKVMIGDAFLGLDSWYGYMKEAQGVLMDLHVYQVFSNAELSRSYEEHVSFMCSRAGEFTSYASQNLWLVMGEWSTAPTDCAKYLNGRGVGSRWDASYLNDNQYHGTCYGMTGSYYTFSEEYKAFLRKYWEAQVSVAEMANGWISWTWKAENADDWSYQKGLEAGFIPRNPDDRLYPGICG